MLKIRRENHLADQLGMSLDRLHLVANNFGEHVEELLLLDPANPNKPRNVINLMEPLRSVQSRIYRRLLLPRLSSSVHSHGGVANRHIKTNVLPHVGSVFGFTTDISSFYPNIHHSRVYNLFVGYLECSPDVARLLTRLCTYKHHLALGLSTSPLLADLLMNAVDRRIGLACSKEGLVYTRFVDDISITANLSLDPESCGIPALITKILDENGFVVQKRKHKYGRLEDGFTLTSLSIRRGSIDISRDYINKLDAQLLDAQRIASGEMPIGLYYTYQQLRGRVEFAAWVNRNRRRSLIRRLRLIDWSSVQANAIALKLESSKKRLVPRLQTATA